jgi:glycerol-3-phosphate dehydrogenase
MQAEDVVDVVCESRGLKQGIRTKGAPSLTVDYPLRGGRGYTKNVPVRLVQEFGVSEESAIHLARTYGMHAFDVCKLTQPTGNCWPRFGRLLDGYPYLECEVEYACQEYVRTVCDMLALRFRLAFLNSEAAIAVAPRVADLMAVQLHWNREERDDQLKVAMSFLKEFGGPVPNANFEAATLTDVNSLFALLDLDANGYIDFPEYVCPPMTHDVAQYTWSIYN